mgnify:CR=1 FL=1
MFNSTVLSEALMQVSYVYHRYPRIPSCHYKLNLCTYMQLLENLVSLLYSILVFPQDNKFNINHNTTTIALKFGKKLEMFWNCVQSIYNKYFFFSIKYGQINSLYSFYLIGDKMYCVKSIYIGHINKNSTKWVSLIQALTRNIKADLKLSRYLQLAETEHMDFFLLI